MSYHCKGLHSPSLIPEMWCNSPKPHCNAAEIRVQDIPTLVAQGLLWVVDMYRSGRCGDYWFTYECFAPAVSAILEAMAEQAAQPLSASRALTGALRPFA